MFVLVETIIEIRRKQFWKKELILASAQLIFWLAETIFFFIFHRLLSVIYGLLETSFNKILYSGYCKFIFWLVETAFFCSEVFPSSETIAEISGSQLLKKDQILMWLTFWLVEAIFFHFLRQQSTATSGSSLFYNWSIFFSQSFIPASTSKFFVYWKHCFFVRFFLLVENIIEIREKSTFKDAPYSC